MNSGNGKSFYVTLLVLLTGVSALTGFLWLFFHNQAQTQFTINYDLWRSYNLLAGHGDIKQYLFHNVHTYAIVSLLWYMDVLLAGGSLKLFHGAVTVAMIGAFAALAIACLRLFRAATAHKANAVVVTVIAMALWFSPSNAVGYTYPVVDVLSASLFLSLMLATLLVNNAADGGRGLYFRTGNWLAYLLVAVVGFFSLEPFLIVPIFLSLDAALRRRFGEALFHALVAAALVALYAGLRDQSFFHGPNAAHHRNLLIFLQNFLAFLSMHVLMLFDMLKIDPAISTCAAIAVSILQLVVVGMFAFTHYRQQGSRPDVTPRFALALAAVGIVSIALATWLRHSVQLSAGAVDRYTPYSVFFAMAAFVLASRTLVMPGAVVPRLASAGVYVVTIAYLIAEAWAFWAHSYNPAARFPLGRMEMAVYATNPGMEDGLGPGPFSRDRGLAFRSNLHSFLKSRELSVFGSAGYQALGRKLPAPNTSGELRCQLAEREIASASRPQLTRITARLDGAGTDGIFASVDERGVIVAFGLPVKVHPTDETVQTLMPPVEAGLTGIHYVELDGSEPVAAALCLPASHPTGR